MTSHWNSEIMKWEYRELQATAMSVDFTGNNVMLAGRRWLAIKQISLDEDSEDIIKKYPRQSKYDAAGAEWCQTYDGQKLLAIASNQRVDVYEWRSGNDLTCICSLRGHTRVVSDTHFHRQDHNLIATCSIDTFTHLWDLRDARKPVMSLNAVAGASQVQWNKVVSHIVATAHDGDIKIWDYRKHSSPMQYISAHLCKIHGVDWSPHHEYQLVTSSHDGSIKYFDINNPRKPENVIMTNFPVWRAIYTPFGSGLLTIGVGWGGLPRMEQSGVIGVWVGGTLTHRLIGHTDTVQTMVWRPNMTPSNYQLVTWGRDQSLRIWPMHSSLLKMCNHYLPDESDDDVADTKTYASVLESNILLKNNKNKKGTEVESKIKTEFDSIRNLDEIEVSEVDTTTRTCQVNTERNGHIAKLLITFPKNVVELPMPKFSWLSGTNIESSTTINILQTLHKTAYRKKKENQNMLFPCLMTLEKCIDEIPIKSNEETNITKPNKRSQSECENAADSCIPFPRTCGAKWCSVSTLVVFTRPPNSRRLSLKHERGTPRSMSSLTMIPGLFGSSYSSISPHTTTTPSPTNPSGFSQLYHRHASNSITTFYFQDRWKTQSRRAGTVRVRGGMPAALCARVSLYCCDSLFPFSRPLAQRYVVDIYNPIEMCASNARACVAEGEAETARVWRVCGLVAGAAEAVRFAPPRAAPPFYGDEEAMGWAGHPACCSMLQAIIAHFAAAADFQTAAMLVCAFSMFLDTNSSSTHSSMSTSSDENGTSPYSTVNQYSEISADGWTLPTLLRSSSCSEAENFYTETTATKSEMAEAGCILDTETAYLYNCYKRIYADILYRWQLLYKRTEVMKLVDGASDCCVAESFGGARGVRCAVCALPVRGLAAACLHCAHAGHASHVLHWFKKYEYCPTGCGCKCMKYATPTWKGVKYAQ